MNWQSADLFDGLSGENPPWGMKGGPSVKGAAEGLRRPLQVERTGKIVPGLAAMPRRYLGQSKITRMSAEVIRLRRTAMRLVPAAGRLFEGTKQMRDGSNRDLNVGIGGCVSWLSTCSVTFGAQLDRAQKTAFGELSKGCKAGYAALR
jgi:hypothetical protein